MARGPHALLALAALCACGPIRSTQLIVEAQAELAAAENAKAGGVAPYEMTAADLYLHKAREEQSYAEFERSEYLARKSRDCAHFARRRAELVARAELGAGVPQDGEELPSNRGCAPVYAEGLRPAGKVVLPAAKAKDPAAPPPKPAAKGEPKEPDDPMPEGE